MVTGRDPWESAEKNYFFGRNAGRNAVTGALEFASNYAVKPNPIVCLSARKIHEAHTWHILSGGIEHSAKEIEMF